MTEKTNKTKAFGLGSFGLTFLLMVIFGIIGAIVSGWTGLGVGLVMPLIACVISYAGIIPFVGFWLYILAFNPIFDWLYKVIPQMGVFLAPDALPRIVLFWIFLILSALATVIISIVVLALLAVLVKALVD